MMSAGRSSSVILADRSAAVGNLQGFGVCARLRATIVGLSAADEDARAEDKTSSVVTVTDKSPAAAAFNHTAATAPDDRDICVPSN